MMYDAVIEQMLESALVKASKDFLDADQPKDKVLTSKIFCDNVDRAIKLISVQDERAKEEAKLEAAIKRDDAEIDLKLKQFQAELDRTKQELLLRSEAQDLEAKKMGRQIIFDVVKFGTGILVTVGMNLIYLRFDAKGNMFTTSFGKRRAEESTRLNGFLKF